MWARAAALPRRAYGAARGAAREAAAAVFARSARRVDGLVSVGGRRAAADPATVRRLGVTHVIELCAGDPAPVRAAHPGVAYLRIAARDAPEYPIDAHFGACLRFIRAAAAAGGHVLVHCRAGVSRSVAVVAFYRMAAHGETYARAMWRVRRARPMAWPNAGFRARLAAAGAALAEKGRGPPPLSRTR
jgi:predicted protein tyrosine phosphatase